MRKHVIPKIGLMLILWGLCSSFAFSQEADLILHNAKITTLDLKNPSATAVAIKKGRIIQVGKDSEVLKLKGESTKVLDVQSRRIIPGLNDSHSHYIRGGRFFNAELRWDGVPSLAIGLKMIRQQALRTPKGQWVRVIGGWSRYQFKEKRFPTLEELNEVAPNTPVYVQYLYSRGYLNQAGLKAMGIDENTKAPQGSRIELGPNGKPTGLLIADPHAGLLYQTIANLPGLSEKDQANSTIQFFYELARFGLTSVIDVGGGGHFFPENYQIAQKLAEDGKLPLRVSFYLFPPVPGREYSDFQKWVKMTQPETNSDPLRDNGYVMEGGGEYLVWSAGDFENFMSPRPEQGKNMKAELNQVATLMLKNRWPFRLHATYDESVSNILDVLEELNRTIPFNGLRWSIEHGETLSERSVDRIAALGGGIALQNRMAFAGEDFVDRYGAEKASHSPPLRMILNKGVTVGMGTDATRVSSYNPWLCLYWLVTGKTVGGTQLYGPDNRLSREEALSVYTVGSAWFSHEEKVKGRIAKGQYADFAVLSADYMTVAEEDIKNIESVLTVVDGKIVYGAEDFAGYMPSLPPVTPDWSPVKYFGSYWSANRRN